MMKKGNCYICIAVIAFRSCVNLPVARSEEGCCGDKKYDPSTEDCCIKGNNYTVVPKGTCCNGQQLEAGKECCRDGVEFQKQYDPQTECCYNPYARVLSKLNFSDYTECDNRVPRIGGGSDGDGTCTSSPDDPVSAVPSCGDEKSSFLPACLAHDRCFGHCQPGEATAAFNACNNAFNDNIRAICNSLESSICRTACNGFRSVYVAAVRSSVGRGYFDDGQNKACQCCP